MHHNCNKLTNWMPTLVQNNCRQQTKEFEFGSKLRLLQTQRTVHAKVFITNVQLNKLRLKRKKTATENNNEAVFYFWEILHDLQPSQDFWKRRKVESIFTWQTSEILAQKVTKVWTQQKHKGMKRLFRIFIEHVSFVAVIIDNHVERPNYILWQFFLWLSWHDMYDMTSETQLLRPTPLTE